jgi:uncharacterized phage protein (TIGR02218 family)
MRSATPALQALLASGRQFVCADLYTITQATGNALHFTMADVPINWQDDTYSPYGVQISGLRYRVIIGLEADEQTITIAANRTSDVLDGLPFLDAIQHGSLDGARIRRERAYMEVWGGPPVGAVVLFSGFVSSVDALDRLRAELRVKSDICLLDVQMPRNKWQAQCLHTLYDGGCGLSKTASGVSGSVEAGSTRQVINWSGATPAYFWQGTVLMTSGVDCGLRRTIKNSTGSQLVLSYPLPVAPAAGDTFTVFPGCDKTLSCCSGRFNNLPANKSFPFIPTAETAL